MNGDVELASKGWPGGTVPIAVAFLLSWPALTYACGSMGLNDPRTRAVLAVAVFLPMIALVPVEMFILQRAGELKGKVVVAYLACLPAKGAGVVGVALAAQADLIGNVVAAELIGSVVEAELAYLIGSVVEAELAYSMAHLGVAFLVLKFVFDLEGRRLVLASVGISTLIPWLYSLGFWGIVAYGG